MESNQHCGASAGRSRDGQYRGHRRRNSKQWHELYRRFRWIERPEWIGRPGLRADEFMLFTSTPESWWPVTYPSTQTYGDPQRRSCRLERFHRAHQFRVTDSKGNSYVLAVGPTIQSGTASQAIYYAKNISGAAANGNTVTVTFSQAAIYPDVRIAEYAGLDPSAPLDVVASAQGSGTTSSSGSVTTGNANDLLVGANLIQGTTYGPGPGYTQRVITNPDGDILEDSVVTSTGSYSATSSITGGAWIMQMVAFRAAGSSGASSVGTTPSTSQGQLTGSTLALKFGSVNIGSSTSQTMIVSDSGTANVTISNISISGAGIAANGVYSGLVLAPSQTATLSVTFFSGLYGKCVWHHHGRQQRREFTNDDCCVGYRSSADLQLSEPGLECCCERGWLQRIPRVGIGWTVYDANKYPDSNDKLYRHQCTGGPNILLCGDLPECSGSPKRLLECSLGNCSITQEPGTFPFIFASLSW